MLEGFDINDVMNELCTTVKGKSTRMNAAKADGEGEGVVSGTDSIQRDGVVSGTDSIQRDGVVSGTDSIQQGYSPGNSLSRTDSSHQRKDSISSRPRESNSQRDTLSVRDCDSLSQKDSIASPSIRSRHNSMESTLLESMILSKLQIVSDALNNSQKQANLYHELELLLQIIYDHKDAYQILVANNTTYLLISLISANIANTSLCLLGLKVRKCVWFTVDSPSNHPS